MLNKSERKTLLAVLNAILFSTHFRRDLFHLFGTVGSISPSIAILRHRTGIRVYINIGFPTVLKRMTRIVMNTGI